MKGHELVFPSLTPQIARALYLQIPQLRSESKAGAIRNLKKWLGSEEELQVPIVLINDDPSQMRVVAHLPTMIFEDLRCAKLVATRMDERAKESCRDAVKHVVGKEDIAELSKTMNEFPTLLVQSKDSILMEVRTMIEEDRKHRRHQLDQLSENSSTIGRSAEDISTVKEKVMEIIAALNRQWGALNKIYQYLVGFGSQAGYDDPNLRMEEGVARAIGRR